MVLCLARLPWMRPSVAVTNWGSYTPGPWAADDDACIWSPRLSETHAANIATVDMRMSGWPANKRLISRAYLIPRLEAVVEMLAGECWESAAPSYPASARCEDCGACVATVLLAELRSES